MEDKSFKRLEDKLDKLDERLDNIDKTMIRNTVSLEDHIRRTEILEEKIDPIEKQISQVQGALKFTGIVALIAGLIASLAKINGK